MKAKRKYKTGPKKTGVVRDIWSRLKRNRAAVISLAFIVLLLLVVAFADVFLDYQEMAIKQDSMNRLQSPSSEHWFGTDIYGRDYFARVIFGTRYSLLIGFGATAIATVAAMVLSSCCAFFGGKVDSVIMRIMDTVIAVPGIVLTLTMVVGFGSGLWQLFVAIGIAQIASFTRIFRSSMLSVVGSEYIESSRAIGAGKGRIIVQHVIPNVMGIIIVQSTMQVALNILAGSSLSFLGLGAQIPTPEWGALLAEGLAYMRHYPYLVMIPGVALTLTALSINIFGDGLRDALDPRLKGRA